MAVAVAIAAVLGGVIVAAVWMFTGGQGVGSNPEVLGRANIVGALAGLLAVAAASAEAFRRARIRAPAQQVPSA